MLTGGAQYTIRLAGVEDAARVCDFGANAFVAAFGHLYPESDLSAFLEDSYNHEAWAAFIADPANGSWLAEDQSGALAGYAQTGPCGLPVADMAPDAIELKRLYVDPTRVSGGIGAALMTKVMAWSAAKGNPPFYIGVWSENDGAQRFYTRYGFERVGAYKFAVGQTLDHEFILQRKSVD